MINSAFEVRDLNCKTKEQWWGRKHVAYICYVQFQFNISEQFLAYLSVHTNSWDLLAFTCSQQRSAWLHYEHPLSSSSPRVTLPTGHREAMMFCLVLWHNQLTSSPRVMRCHFNCNGLILKLIIKDIISEKLYIQLLLRFNLWDKLPNILSALTFVRIQQQENNMFAGFTPNAHFLWAENYDLGRSLFPLVMLPENELNCFTTVTYRL